MVKIWIKTKRAKKLMKNVPIPLKRLGFESWYRCEKNRKSRSRWDVSPFSSALKEKKIETKKKKKTEQI